MNYNLELSSADAFGNILKKESCNKPKKHRQVGLFYFLWHGTHNIDGLYRFDELLEKYTPEELPKPDSPFYDYPSGAPFFWGEPVYGFYHSQDVWIMRRHVALFTLAGIDFLIIDATNTQSYIEQALLLMRILDRYEKEGFNTPKIMFYTHTDCAVRVKELYEGIYEKNLYKNTWFQVRGKPAIAGNLEDLPQAMLDFFTVKTAQWPNEDQREGGFPWMDFAYPQRIFSNADGSETVVNVSVAQNSAKTARFGDTLLYGDTGNRGRSFHEGEHNVTQDSWLQGFNFKEQWERAIALDPDYVFVTGWNEWTAGVWKGEGARPVAIYDCINGEYSRDIEPMKGGYKDAYFQILIENIARYKGFPAASYVPHRGACGLLENWSGTEGHRAFSGGAEPHKAPKHGGEYSDSTGQNAFSEIKLAQDDTCFYFYAKTEKSLTPSKAQGEWMRLYIFSLEAKALCTYSVCFKEESAFLKNQNGEWLKIKSEVSGNTLVYGIEKKYLPSCFGFKWFDCSEPLASWEDVYTKGNAAPPGPFFYKVSPKSE